MASGSTATRLRFWPGLVRPFAAAGSRWEIPISTVCITLLFILFLAEFQTPDDVVGALALPPLLVAAWVLSNRPAAVVMLVAALLFGAVVVVERANEPTIISIGLALLLTLTVTRLYATVLARGLVGDRHYLRTRKDSSASGAWAVFGDSSQGMFPLTRRELEVARLAAEGYTAVEIGSRLHIGHRTVESHLGNTYSKLHIKSKAQLIRMASKLEEPLG